FLQPVDVSAVAGYAEVIKQPMDFGTMGTKVERGKYRSLEEFASDFRLVISNAKLFNLPGTIYYSEADRID
ncbi:Bromodomain-containing protein, partial [Vararia minispora EC-137]